MTKSYLKVVLMGVVALLLCYFNKAYSLYIMLLFIFVCAINAYQLESHYQRMGRFFQREKDNEIKEVEIENKYHEKILSQLIRSMNLPMLFIDKEGKIAFTNQSFRKGFEIPHLKGRYYKDIFVGEMLDLVDQCYVFERPLSSVVKIQSRYYQVESSPVFSDKEHLIFDGTIVLFTDVSKMKEIEDREKVKILLAQSLFGNPDILLLDEPTNDLDLKTIQWLEEFLINFENTVIVVSHDRYFLNKVCTHIADVDFGKIKVYPGNYDFWYESSQLALKQMKDANKKKEEKIKELQEFIARFSANASKSKQATSRKKSLEKIQLDEIKPSNRRYPYIDFKPDREPGKDILTVKNLSKTVDGEKVLDNVSFTVKTDNKIAIIADNENARTTLFQILAGELEPDEGEVSFGTTITKAYFPKDNSYLFTQDLSITDWLRQYSKDPDETYVRSFLGRMLFSGDEALKNVKVLSGGEKVRCVLSKLMLSGANFLIFDEPTNHLDMESITALNEGMERFKGNMIFASHDHQLMQTVANRIIDIKKDGSVVDKECTYNEYLGLE